MKNKHPLILTLQIYSVFFVVLGIYLLSGLGVSTFVAIRDGQYPVVLLGLFVLGVALTLFFVSYETIFNFSIKSISNLSGITGLIVYLIANRLLRNIDSDNYVFLLQLVIALSPYVIGFYSYRVEIRYQTFSIVSPTREPPVSHDAIETFEKRLRKDKDFCILPGNREWILDLDKLKENFEYTQNNWIASR